MSSPQISPKRPRIVLVVTVYNEQDALPLFEAEVRRVLFSRDDYEFELLFVDDGSYDGTWGLISDMCRRDARIRGIRFSRNFGAHVGTSAGYAEADGDAVATLSADLQDPPEVVLEFLEKWKAGAQIVWGRRRTREDSLWRRMTSDLFFFLVRSFAMPRDSKVTSGGFVLIDRQVVECFLRFQERNRTIVGLVAWTGFQQASVDYDRRARIAGRSGWTIGKMLGSMYDMFIGFSTVPARMMTLLGVGMFLATMALIGYMVFHWWMGHPTPGWTSIIVVIAFLFGVQFLLMGIVGEYLFRIYTESMARPLYLVQERTRDHDSKPSDRVV